MFGGDADRYSHLGRVILIQGVWGVSHDVFSSASHCYTRLANGSGDESDGAHTVTHHGVSALKKQLQICKELTMQCKTAGKGGNCTLVLKCNVYKKHRSGSVFGAGIVAAEDPAYQTGKLLITVCFRVVRIDNSLTSKLILKDQR